MSAYLNSLSPKSSVTTMPSTKDIKNSDFLRSTDLKSSPLQIFVMAKKNINHLFSQIALYLTETHTQLSNFVDDYDEVVKQTHVDEIEKYKENIQSIKEILSRDHMKVVFFGRTSNGKSTVINSLLSNKILPSGIGHTTNCFVQIEGSDNPEPYILTEDSTEPKNITSVLQLANALEMGEWGDSSLIRVLWPKDKCELLKDDVVLVDSPGVDVSLNMDQWIDKHCMDADMFILVSNAESTLMQTEKSFFKRVCEKISNPNTFILHNRWDASAKEPEIMEKVRKQHTDRAMNFFKDDIGLKDEIEAAKRIYFVSAEETLKKRMGKSENPTNEGYIKGYQARLQEFEQFEKMFQESLCRSAVKTKFEKHIQRAQYIIQQSSPFMEEMHKRSSNKIITLEQNNSKMEERLVTLCEQHKRLSSHVKGQIHMLVDTTEREVNTAISNQIRSLSEHMTKFDGTFKSDPEMLNTYKKELYIFLDKMVSDSLRIQLAEKLEDKVDTSIKELTDRVKKLLPVEHHNTLTAVTPLNKFKLIVKPNFETLCSDFEPNLEFRFSLDLSSLIQTFFCKVMDIVHSREPINNQVPTTPQTPSNELKTISPPQGDYLKIIAALGVFAPSTQNLVGSMTIGGILFKTIGWKTLAGIGLCYGGIYMYELMSWNNFAKEKAFKKQFIAHASRQMRMTVDLSSTDCAHQIQQEISGVYSRYGHVLDQSYNEMKENLEKSKSSVNILENLSREVKTLK